MQRGTHDGDSISPWVPPGSPGWITSELIGETIEAWSADYEHKLTAEDALEILLVFDQLLGVLEELDAE